MEKCAQGLGALPLAMKITSLIWLVGGRAGSLPRRVRGQERLSGDVRIQGEGGPVSFVRCPPFNYTHRTQPTGEDCLGDPLGPVLGLPHLLGL